MLTQSSLLRNRDNQRRSRARRKDYIDDLEKRLRKFEREGVRITAEVQAAARTVAEENRLLRSLLIKNGTSAVEIDAHLRRSREPSESLTQMKARTFTEHSQSHEGKDFDHRPSSPHATQPRQITTFLVEETPQEHGMDLAAPGSSEDLGQKRYGNRMVSTECPVRDAGNRFEEQKSEQEDDQQIPKESQATSTRGQASNMSGNQRLPISGTGDETHCEIAAHIITSMRGREDSETVWPELGCTSGRNCMVKNVDIFQMVDQ